MSITESQEIEVKDATDPRQYWEEAHIQSQEAGVPENSTEQALFKSAYICGRVALADHLNKERERQQQNEFFFDELKLFLDFASAEIASRREVAFRVGELLKKLKALEAEKMGG